MPATALLLPVFTLAAWTLLMLVWMGARRLPALARHRIALDARIPQAELMNQLPAKIRWPADNYNHLLEQPTLFYAVSLGLIVLGTAPTWALYCAWSYVALRVVHSIYQSLFNRIRVRFAIFMLSTVALAALTVAGLCATLSYAH